MKLRHLYALVGLVLGALAAVGVMIQVFAFLAGVSWLFLFGDSPWPASAQWYLLGLPPLAGLATLCAALAVGYAVGRRAEASGEPQRARRRGYGLLLAGCLLWVGVLVLGLWQQDRQATARATAAQQEAAFTQLQQARHVITGLRAIDAGDEALRVTLGLAGTRTGAYQLAWRLEDPLYRVTLASGEQRLALGPETATAEVTLERAALAERYRQTVLQGRNVKVLVDGRFRLRLWLEPLLAEDERQALPAREIGNLERGLSALRFETEVKVPVRLDLTAP